MKNTEVRMTVIGVDDTDSRTLGMCTTYVGHKIAELLEAECDAAVYSLRLIRLNPAAKHKTRGNAAVAIFTDAEVDTAYNIASSFIEENAAMGDKQTNPGLVVSDGFTVPPEVQEFSERAIRELLSREDALSVLKNLETYRVGQWENGRGIIGATAAIGAKDAFSDWTYEKICYREEQQWGTEREVSHETIFEGADEVYPKAWDTVDRTQNESVCVPHTPCPILFGLRGDDKDAIETLQATIESETIAESRIFITNQGTDIHLQSVPSISQVSDNSAYRVTGTVCEAPRTIEGGHTIFTLEDESGTIECAAFEPTKHFRKKVRKFREGDKITVCGEVKDNTLKIEKLRVNTLNNHTLENPTCPSCENSMSSAGRNQGYRCKSCSEYADEKVSIQIDRDLKENTWYEVPPCARRHIAKPLIRGGFNGKIKPFN